MVAGEGGDTAGGVERAAEAETIREIAVSGTSEEAAVEAEAAAKERGVDEARVEPLPPVRHVHFATLPGMWDRTITISSAGKTFSVTGWQVLLYHTVGLLLRTKVQGLLCRGVVSSGVGLGVRVVTLSCVRAVLCCA